MTIEMVYLNFILAVMIPGVSFNMILYNKMHSSSIDAFKVAIGAVLAEFIHTLYTYYGFALLITSNILLQKMLSYLLIFFLIYFALPQSKKHENKKLNSYAQGFLVNLVNPRAAVFYLSILDVWSRNNTQLISYKYFIVFPIIVLTVDIGYILILNNRYISRFIEKYFKWLKIFNSAFYLFLAFMIFLNVK